MLRVFGDNNWSITPSSLTETVTIHSNDLYSSDQDKTMLEIIKKKYENKSTRKCFIKKITKILEYSPWECITYNTDGLAECHVVFEALVDEPKIGDIIVGAVCESGGKGNDVICLKKDYMEIYARCGPNMPQVIQEQLITIKIRDITWKQFSPSVTITGMFTHASAYANKTYELIGSKVKAQKDLIAAYEKQLEALGKFDPKMGELAYPFSKTQTPYKLTCTNFHTLLKSLLDGTITSVYIMRSCFIPKESNSVYQVPKPNIKCNETNNKVCIREIYEDTIRQITLLQEMAKIDFKPYLFNFYATSKVSNDTQIPKVLNSYLA